MKTLLSILICVVLLSACITRDEPPVITNEIHCNDNAKIQTLTLQIEKLNKEHYQPQTRIPRFFKRLLSVLYSDACGYSWGRRSNLDYRLTLVSAAVSSLATAINRVDTIHWEYRR